MISALTKVYGIVGNPTEHSLSPVLQNILAEKMGVDMSYVAFNVKDNIKSAIEGAFALGINGLNVTIPYKKDVLKLAVETDRMAERIGAVNTLVREAEGYKGYNTDIIGLKLSLESNDMNISDKNVIILGAGGASKAALHLAIEEGARCVTIVNRDLNKAAALKEEVSAMYQNINILSLDAVRENVQALSENDYFVFQTTNVGMYPHVSDCIIEAEGFYEKCAAGIDLIYTPEQTVFIKKMGEHNRKCINGLDMLILQGIASFEIWNEIKVSSEAADAAKEVLIKILKERMQ